MKQDEETPEKTIDEGKEYPYEVYEIKKQILPGALVINFVKKS